MRKFRLSAVRTIVTGILFLVAAGAGNTPRLAAQARNGFGFNATNISGFPTGAVSLTGGGAYVPGTTFVHAGGSFTCTRTVSQLQLNGCLEGQGVRWDTAALIASTPFKCTGAASEPLKTATTSGNTVVLIADFYRRGDGTEESFTARMFVSDTDQDPLTPGVQNIWIQGVGCGSAIANFN